MAMKCEKYASFSCKSGEKILKYLLVMDNYRLGKLELFVLLVVKSCKDEQIY